MSDALFKPKAVVGLTRTQSRCLAAIKDAIARDGISPSYNELKVTLGLKSKSHIHQLVRQLEQRGAIVRRIGSARSITPTRSFPTQHTAPCPHCGKTIIEERV